MNAYIRYLPVVGRLLIAALFLFSGIGKIAAPTMTLGYIAAAGLPAPLVPYLAAIIVEVGGGLLLVLGFQTPIVALVMAIFTIAAALGFHHDFSDQNQLIHFMKDIAITGGLLQVVAFGAGGFSIDAWRAEKSQLTGETPRRA